MTLDIEHKNGSSEMSKGSESILVVDDFPINLEIMEGLLHKEGFNVITALNAEEALNIIEATDIDLAILDVMMPGMNGYELCRRLKGIASRRFFPVILVTALNELSDKIAGLEAGADDFLSKPFHTIELITKIKSLLRLKQLQNELDHSEDIIMTLAVAIEAKDPYTKGHSERVGHLSMELAAYIGLSEKEQHLLLKAGVLHDIGKLGISEMILHKTGNLLEYELEAVKQHSTIGADICRPLNSLKVIIPVIKYHHERWDGTGFPDGLKGEQIPLLARILAIADTFDAMISERPYRVPFPEDKALGIMEKEKGLGQWDPELIQKFLEMKRAEKKTARDWQGEEEG